MSSRPLIGVTSSEMRVAKSVEPTPQGEPPRKEMALGLAYLRAIEAAGGLPLVIPPMPSEAVTAAGRATPRRLPLGRTGYPPAQLRGGPARRAGAHRAGARPLRAGAGARGARAQPAGSGDLPRGAALQRGDGRHAGPASSRGHRRDHHAPSGGRRRAGHARGRAGHGERVGARARESGRGRQLVPPPGDRPARSRPTGRRLVAGRRGGGDRGARSRLRASACSGTRSAWSSAPSTCASSRAWSRRRSATQRGRRRWRHDDPLLGSVVGRGLPGRLHARGRGGDHADRPAGVVARAGDRPGAAGARAGAGIARDAPRPTSRRWSCGRGCTRTCPGSRRELEDLRGALEGQLRTLGLRAAASGTHPFAVWQEMRVSTGPRYQHVYDSMRELARREPTFALHVHVGVASPDAAIDLMNRMRGHLPLLLALSANSPLWQGRDTGLASARTPLFQAFPRVGIPRTFRDYGDWVAAVEVLLRCEAFAEPTFLWWDVRPQPRFGTVEVRILDAQSTVAETVALDGARAVHRPPRARGGLYDARGARPPGAARGEPLHRHPRRHGRAHAGPGPRAARARPAPARPAARGVPPARPRARLRRRSSSRSGRSPTASAQRASSSSRAARTACPGSCRRWPRCSPRTLRRARMASPWSGVRRPAGFLELRRHGGALRCRSGLRALRCRPWIPAGWPGPGRPR